MVQKFIDINYTKIICVLCKYKKIIESIQIIIENLIHIFETGWTGSGRLREKS